METYPFDPDDAVGIGPNSTEDSAIKFIESGADIHAICNNNQDTLLHLAVRMRFMDAAELLIKKGADINAQNLQGHTPLLILLIDEEFVDGDALDNFVSMLLYYGADVTICDARGKNALELSLNLGHFDKYVLNILENLIFYGLDSYSDYRLPVNVFFSIFHVGNSSNNLMFLQVLDFLRHLELDGDGLQPDGVNFYAVRLFSEEIEFLQSLLQKFPRALSQILRLSSRNAKPIEEYFFNSRTIENFKLMLESDLCWDTVEFIGKIRIADLIDEGIIEGTVELIYYLLTYGLLIYEEDLEVVYKRFGYCDLFKHLLYMDMKKYPVQRDIMPAIFYDMSLDIEKFLEDPHNYSLNSLSDLLDHFALPKLKNLCYSLNVERLVAKAKCLPKVPRLEELARNASRKFLIAEFHVRTSKEFYTIIKWLPISEVYKKIISLETKLY